MRLLIVSVLLIVSLAQTVMAEEENVVWTSSKWSVDGLAFVEAIFSIVANKNDGMS